jgi:hypothetical protein
MNNEEILTVILVALMVIWRIVMTRLSVAGTVEEETGMAKGNEEKRPMEDEEKVVAQ